MAIYNRYHERYPRAYQSWRAMKKRCDEVNNVAYPRYGGRGISYDPLWKKFKNFFEDMGYPPVGHTLERKDVNGNYCKENCRWATIKEQSLNTSRSLILTYKGKSQTAHEWAVELGVSPKTLRQRLYRGWTVEQTLETKVKK